MTIIKYQTRYKYELIEDYRHNLGFDSGTHVGHPFFDLQNDQLVINAGYAWDGATGAIDTQDFMRGSLVHDCLFQMIREKMLGTKWAKQMDKELVRICEEDGMHWLRRWYVYTAVRQYSKRTFGE